jgi:hypothetical protein
VFLYSVVHQKQIEKPIDSPFGSHGVDVCTKLLHYGDFPMYYNYQILGLVEKSEGCRCVVNTKIAQQTPTTKSKP